MCPFRKVELADLIKAAIGWIVSFAVIGVLIEEKRDDEHKSSTHISYDAIYEGGNLLVPSSSASLFKHGEEYSAICFFILGFCDEALSTH